SRADRRYSDRAAQARQRGYLWGAYHVAAPGDPVAQADFFLTRVGDAANTLLALDVEDAASMSPSNVLRFLQRVRERTGQTPLLYGNRDVLRAFTANPTFVRDAGARLWYARFRRQFDKTDLGAWRDYFLWQFSSELNCSADGACPYNPPGVHYD